MYNEHNSLTLAGAVEYTNYMSSQVRPLSNRIV